MAKLTATDLRPAGRRVLVRADLNVPVGPGGEVADEHRLRAVAATLTALSAAGARVVVASHLGRPGGRRVAGLSLAPIAERLAVVLGRPVAFAGDCVGATARRAIEALRDGDVLLLENLRFHAAEEAPAGGTAARDFAAALAGSADFYVNDAFATAHREHASLVTVPSLLPVGRRAAGLLMTEELRRMAGVLRGRRHPFTVLLGGDEADRLPAAVERLSREADVILTVGAPAAVLGAARGTLPAGEWDGVLLETVRRASELCDQRQCTLLTPIDCRSLPEGAAAEGALPDAELRVERTPSTGRRAVDIGTETAALYREILIESATVVWSGAAGDPTRPATSAGTRALAEAITRLASSGGHVIVADGPSGAAVRGWGLGGPAWMSTGDVACLHVLEDRELPCLRQLDDRKDAAG